jgi:hypothetical protein
MSDINGKLKTGNAAAQEAENTLSDLSASKHLHNKPANTPTSTLTSTLTGTPANNLDNPTDLTSVSMGGTNVIRTSPPPQGQPRIISACVKHTPTQSTKQSSASTGSAKQEFGLFKNPKYSYRGDIISKIISFFANLLKVLERIFLRLIGGGDKVAPPTAVQKTASPAKSTTERPDPQVERDKQRRKQQTGLRLKQ